MAREADLRYQPMCKDLKDAVCFPGPEEIAKMSIAERQVHITILTNYIDEEPTA